jgi:probable F420-dependent oxidoreductase
MQLGTVIGFDGGPGREMPVFLDTVRRAEAAGLDAVWVPEHVVFVAGATSKYPYNETGELNLGKRPGVYDPLIALTAAAAVTERVRLGTGILIVPQRNPVVLAQEIVALDHVSAGRFDLGIGVGWLQEEFEAIGVPWAQRGARTDDYLRALDVLWGDEVSSYEGPFVSFCGVQAWPKPVQQPRPPVWVGGNTDAALRRTALLGDGWYGWNFTVDEVAGAVAGLHAVCEREGRDPATVRVVLGRPWPGDFAAVPEYLAAAEAAGVEQVILAPATRGVELAQRVEDLAVAVGR